ncbi:MAG: hypothetical protein COX62_07015 [Deltaproteobacteria bacterium CG_4_10_14_0_2_um_filter_43_8]|nr:MAG: hypothetical protein COV43_04160 [Deltaproteobacteria bacterium CG11_big_fil_rev_8_21_14_0_20_42_23]PJA19245.1 MAG: hypothetical protein COX62_07015 [Deltaproteobacteria bacterium CG_4_10_14_0_2_um_filter_43_8]PJC64120.1 MAG: hypothetical protein CO021_05865 [Deltaproteobacteria bacterium CG_4_9_14_0_2_um_filter_42_21]
MCGGGSSVVLHADNQISLPQLYETQSREASVSCNGLTLNAISRFGEGFCTYEVTQEKSGKTLDGTVSDSKSRQIDSFQSGTCTVRVLECKTSATKKYPVNMGSLWKGNTKPVRFDDCSRGLRFKAVEHIVTREDTPAEVKQEARGKIVDAAGRKVFEINLSVKRNEAEFDGVHGACTLYGN